MAWRYIVWGLDLGLSPCIWVMLNESFKFSGLNSLICIKQTSTILPVKIMIFQSKQNLTNKIYTSKYLIYISWGECSALMVHHAVRWQKIWEMKCELPVLNWFMLLFVFNILQYLLSTPARSLCLYIIKNQNASVGLAGCTSSLPSIPTE